MLPFELKERVRAAGVFAFVAVLGFGTALAQDPPLQPGQRVRVTAPDMGVARQEATFNTLTGGVLTITADSTMQCPISDVTRVEVGTGRR